jgi:hypothetical protein
MGPVLVKIGRAVRTFVWSYLTWPVDTSRPQGQRLPPSGPWPPTMSATLWFVKHWGPLLYKHGRTARSLCEATASPKSKAVWPHIKQINLYISAFTYLPFFAPEQMAPQQAQEKRPKKPRDGMRRQTIPHNCGPLPPPPPGPERLIDAADQYTPPWSSCSSGTAPSALDQHCWAWRKRSRAASRAALIALRTDGDVSPLDILLDILRNALIWVWASSIAR